jgi:hypothetical protein
MYPPYALHPHTATPLYPYEERACCHGDSKLAETGNIFVAKLGKEQDYGEMAFRVAAFSIDRVPSSKKL